LQDSKNIKIIQTVATGGTAVLFKAVQTSLDRIVAVKRLHAHLTDDENFTRRFILEAKAAASLDHPNIVRVIDFGEVDGSYQMVMEFVEGDSLKEVMERWRPVKFDLALCAVHQILMGLEHAHSKGIVHRDIKPGNVMLTEQGKVKITDFGLAKLTQSSQSHTADDSILGTPLYMSPEQAFGESVDQRSDLFSLGTVLYELLTGRQPFASDNYMGVIQNIINRDVPRPRQLVPDLPAEVESIVGKALARDRDNRFQSARQFRQRIEDYMGPTQLEATAARLKVLLENNTITREFKAPTPEPQHARGGRRAAAGVVLFAVLAAGTAAVLMKPALLERVTGVPAGTLQRADAIDPGVYHFDMSEVVDIDHEPIDTAATSTRSPFQTAPAGNGAPGIRTPVESPDVTPMATTRPPAVTQKKPEPEPEQKPVARIGFLSVASTPAAEVWVDGVYKGDAPVKLELRSGRHSVELRHPNYEPYQENLRITSGELSRRNVTMKKMQGSISLATQEGAELFVDGERYGMTPIMRPIVLDAGRHMLSLKKQGYFEWSSEVTIESKKTLPLKITLSRRY